MMQDQEPLSRVDEILAGHEHVPRGTSESQQDQPVSFNQVNPDAEICICAAQKLDDGRVIRGHRHDDCIQTALKWKAAGQHIGHPRMELQGFVTSRNRFVDRKEGARLMREAGHYSPYAGTWFKGDVLFSEDLY